MSRLSGRVANFLWRFRWLLLAALLPVTLLALRALQSLGVANSLDVWYPEDDPALLAYREFQATYGSDEIIVVAVSAGFVLDTDRGIDLVATLTDALLDIDGVANVTSLVTVPESLAEARGRLLSADRLTTALIVQTLLGQDIEARRPQILREIRREVAEKGLVGHLGGYGVVYEGLNEASTTGAATLVSSAHLVMIALLWLLFRRTLPVLLTLAAVGTAIVWTMGLYALAGNELNMVTMVLPTLVLVIGIANCMHMLRSIAAVDHRLAQQDRVVAGLTHILGPCSVMSVTTAAGFLALTVSDLPVVRQLGWFGAVGMIATFVSASVVITAGLTWPRCEPDIRHTGLDRLASGLHRIGNRHALPVIAVFLVLCVVSVYGISRLKSDTDSIGYLKLSHPIRQDSDFIEAEIGPYVPIEFTVTAANGIFTGPEFDAIWRWQQRAENIGGIGWSWSVLSTLGLPASDLPAGTGIDELRTRIERLRRLSPTTAAAMMSGDGEIRVSFGARIMSARAVQALIREILQQADFPLGLMLRPAGYSPLYTRIVDEIVTSQAHGFALAIVLIVGLIGIALRSCRRLLLAIPANALPVMATLGLMGLTGIPLDVASATIASVILGLVVDDTVHLLNPSAAGVRRSIEIAAGRVGGTLVMTSLVLCAGFLVLGLAEIRSIAWFGVLSSFAVIVAILTDLALLPALASLNRATAGLRSGTAEGL